MTQTPNMYWLGILLFSIGITGCDPAYGIFRSLKNIPSPPFKCIEDSLTRMKGVTDVSYRFKKGRRRFLLLAPDEFHFYEYKYAGQYISFYFKVRYKNEIEFHHHYAHLGLPPKQKDVNKVRPIMLKFEHLIEDHCSVQGFTDAIKESCTGGILCK